MFKPTNFQSIGGQTTQPNTPKVAPDFNQLAEELQRMTQNMQASRLSLMPTWRSTLQT